MMKGHCRRHQVLALEDHVSSLNRLSAAEQDYKDCLHERLQGRCQQDYTTECWIYLGNREPDGQVRVRVGAFVYKLGRVSAWLYLDNFEIWDRRQVIHLCKNLACFNPDHLRIVSDRSEAMRVHNGLRRQRSREESRHERRAA